MACLGGYFIHMVEDLQNISLGIKVICILNRKLKQFNCIIINKKVFIISE